MSLEDNAVPEVAIVDYGMGNLFSVRQACGLAGLDARITSDKRIIEGASALILPGVGAFGDAMDNLKTLDLIGVVRDFIASRRPFMGICLGMQLLMNESEEFGPHKGMGIFGGRVVKFQPRHKDSRVIKVPHVGWNRIYAAGQGRWDGSPLEGLSSGEFMYFVHSFYVVPERGGIILSDTTYEDVEYCSTLREDNVFACQFHPERSGRMGLAIYQNFAAMIRRTRGKS